MDDVDLLDAGSLADRLALSEAAQRMLRHHQRNLKGNKRHTPRKSKDPNRKMRAAIYVRLSKETEETTSPVRQRNDAEKVVDMRGFEFNPDTDYYEDIDVSGYHYVRRPAFERLMMNLHRYDVIIVWKIDRLGRRLTKFVDLLKHCDEFGTKIISANEPIFDTTDEALGMLILQLLMIFAEFEARQIAMRVKSAQNHMVRNGRWRGGRSPFGWQPYWGDRDGVYPERVSDTHWLVLKPGDADLLLKAISEIVENHKSVTSICREWNAAGITTYMSDRRKEETGTNGGPWRASTLTRLLRSPILIGYVAWNDSMMMSSDGDMLEVAEPLIDDVLFYRLQQELDGRTGNQGDDRGRGAPRAKTLFGGMIQCADCGRLLVSNGAKGGNYLCRGNRAGTGKECQGNAIQKKYLDPFVLSFMEKVINDYVKTDGKHFGTLERGTAHRTARIEELMRTQLRLETAYNKGYYSSPDKEERYFRDQEAIDAELIELQRSAENEEILVSWAHPLLDLVKTGPVTAERLVELAEKDLPAFRSIAESAVTITVTPCWSSHSFKRHDPLTRIECQAAPLAQHLAEQGLATAM